ncbi:MAG TPA: methyltransferase domain-containing protein [bacterium]|nr:methyltransferase domain-containing protein [bacterium]
MEHKVRKDKVVAGFSRAAESYDTAAVVQRRNAQQLAAIVKTHCPETKGLAPFLEIGAGTGFLTEYLIQLGVSRGLVTDIAPAMVGTLRKSYGDFPELAVRELDGERFSLGDRFNAVLSSSTFQWFSSLLDPFLNIRRHLERDGLFAFCMFVDGTFRELRHVVSAVGCPYPGHRLFDANDVVRTMRDSGFTVEHFSVLDAPVHYPDTLQFFKAIKAIGATNARGELLAPQELKRVINRYDTEHRRADGVTATYTTLFVLGRKRGTQ